MSISRNRAAALVIIAMAFSLLTVGATFACETCAPVDCPGPVARHAAAPFAVPTIAAPAIEPSAALVALAPPGTVGFASDGSLAGPRATSRVPLRL